MSREQADDFVRTVEEILADGERWVATSALWPIARAVEIATAVQEFFAERQQKMARHHSFLYH